MQHDRHSPAARVVHADHVDRMREGILNERLSDLEQRWAHQAGRIQSGIQHGTCDSRAAHPLLNRETSRDTGSWYRAEMRQTLSFAAHRPNPRANGFRTEFKHRANDCQRQAA
jgi:hypothetical protein